MFISLPHWWPREKFLLILTLFLHLPLGMSDRSQSRLIGWQVFSALSPLVHWYDYSFLSHDQISFTITRCNVNQRRGLPLLSLRLPHNLVSATNHFGDRNSSLKFSQRVSGLLNSERLNVNILAKIEFALMFNIYLWVSEAFRLWMRVLREFRNSHWINTVLERSSWQTTGDPCRCGNTYGRKGGQVHLGARWSSSHVAGPSFHKPHTHADTRTVTNRKAITG